MDRHKGIPKNLIEAQMGIVGNVERHVVNMSTTDQNVVVFIKIMLCSNINLWRI